MHICTIQLLNAFRVFLASNSICSQIGQPNNAQRYACAPYMRMPQQSLCARRIISLPSSYRLASGSSSSSSWHTHTRGRSLTARRSMCPISGLSRVRIVIACVNFVSRALSASGAEQQQQRTHMVCRRCRCGRRRSASPRDTRRVHGRYIYMYCRVVVSANPRTQITRSDTHSHSRAARDRLQNAYKQIVRNNVCVCAGDGHARGGGDSSTRAHQRMCTQSARAHNQNQYVISADQRNRMVFGCSVFANMSMAIARARFEDGFSIKPLV